ncbi:unnamed protein product [Cochlearia groenlandica]
MGRVKIEMKKIEDRQQRNIAFAKRKIGILKKAYELYILCDVQIALILFSPSGKLFLFDVKSRIEETIDKYINLPRHQRGRIQDEPLIRDWVDDMRSQTMNSVSNSILLRENFDHVLRYQTPSKDIEDEIHECKVQISDVDKQLEYFVRISNISELRVDEINYREKLLQTTLNKVQSQKQILEVESKKVDVSTLPSYTNSETSSGP